jgi:hypothetical protein
MSGDYLYGADSEQAPSKAIDLYGIRWYKLNNCTSLVNTHLFYYPTVE